MKTKNNKGLNRIKMNLPRSKFNWASNNNDPGQTESESRMTNYSRDELYRFLGTGWSRGTLVRSLNSTQLAGTFWKLVRSITLGCSNPKSRVEYSSVRRKSSDQRLSQASTLSDALKLVQILAAQTKGNMSTVSTRYLCICDAWNDQFFGTRATPAIRLTM